MQMKDPRRLLKMVVKGGLAIFDQGLVTGSNFLVNIVLARWLPADQYGAYAIAFSVFLLVGMLYQSLLLEPMGVFGASTYKNSLRGYFKDMLGLHAISSLVIVVVTGSAAGIAFELGKANGLAGALFGIALAAPLILLFWLVRRGFYIQLAPGPSTVAGVVYCLITLGGLMLAYRQGWLSPFTALLLMGVGGLGAAVPLLMYLMRTLSPDVSTTDFSETCLRHWRYGRWALASSTLAWVPVNIFYPLVSSFAGIAQAGDLKALVNLTAPVWQPVAALSTLLLPYATKTQEQKGAADAHRLSRQVSLVFMSGTAVYWCLLFLFRNSAFHALYSGRYAGVMYLIPVLALGSTFWSGFVGPANALRAMESPMSVFYAVVFASAAAIVIGVPCTRFLGLKGAIWAMTASQGIGFVAANLLLRRRVHKDSRPLDFQGTPEIAPGLRP
jgi:O-antigen/teichoic acid export membrane protein